ncbi:oligosaccharide flippase family protein [Cruoricaptor ignavus]|uniref:oligosaccharide flippase family protein n=1 Tax=Cruoricaptor ignavus TaxID=1118202 RepID=UPI00370D4205
MKSLWHFLRSFLRGNGQWVFLAFAVAKLTSFFTNVLLIRFLTKEDFGLLSIAPAFFTVFAPFAGLGYPNALLRYGLLAESEEDQGRLSADLFRRGFFSQVILSVLFFLCSLFYIDRYEGIIPIFTAFAVRLLGLFVYTHIQCELRVRRGNAAYARFTLANALLQFAIVVAAAYSGGLRGYLIAFALAPFLSLFWKRGRYFSLIEATKVFSIREMRSFSLHTGITNALSELLYSADILMISFLMNEQAVAEYRTAILIPSNIIFLAQSFLQADYPELVKKHADRAFVRNYILQFYKLFLPVSAVLILVLFIWDEEIIRIFFGETYTGTAGAFRVLTVAFAISMLIKVLANYLLAASGFVRVNTATGVLSVLVLVCAGAVLVPPLGILGMAWAMLIALLVAGAVGFALYFSKINFSRSRIFTK